MNAILFSIVDYIVYFAYTLAVIVILVGFIRAFIIYIKDFRNKKKSYLSLKGSRLELGHSFSLGLGFLIGASIINTILAPTWDDIGKLAAIVALRTLMNYFLTREIHYITTNKLDN